MEQFQSQFREYDKESQEVKTVLKQRIEELEGENAALKLMQCDELESSQSIKTQKDKNAQLEKQLKQLQSDLINVTNESLKHQQTKQKTQNELEMATDEIVRLRTAN